MNSTNIALGLASMGLPIAVAANQVPVPEGTPMWLAILLAALGPSCVGLVHLLGKTLMLSVAGYFSARAKAKKELASKLLSDKDKSNDAEAHKLLLSAQAEEGAAKALESSAMKVKE